ncbi:MAG: hypothetical protein AB7E52_08835 [Bdellovibrionales bacterium]
MIRNTLFTHQYVVKKPNLCKALNAAIERVETSQGEVDPKTAMVFILAHELKLVRRLVWGDVGEDKCPYTGGLDPYDSLEQYPLKVRQNLYKAAMRGVFDPKANDLKSLTHALVLDSSEVPNLIESASAPCGRNNIRTRHFFDLLYPTSAYKRKILKRLGPAESELKSKGYYHTRVFPSDVFPATNAS